MKFTFNTQIFKTVLLYKWIFLFLNYITLFGWGLNMLLDLKALNRRGTVACIRLVGAKPSWNELLAKIIPCYSKKVGEKGRSINLLPCAWSILEYSCKG